MEDNNQKKDSEIFCPECGKPISRQAVVCPHCVVQEKELKTSIQKNTGNQVVQTKTKSTAVILSVLFAHWSWLYTYKKNSKKFWKGFGIDFIFIFITFILILNFNAAELFLNYGTWIWFFRIIISLGLWVWALVDNTSKTDLFYSGYPHD